MTMAPQAANNKPERVSKTPPTMYNASVLYSPPTLGQCWGWIATYEPDRLSRMLKEVGEKTAELALKSFEIAIKAMGVKEPGPEMRLSLYRVKPPELWMEQSAKFPWRFEHDMQDWEALEQKYPQTQPEPTLPEVTP